MICSSTVDICETNTTIFHGHHRRVRYGNIHSVYLFSGGSELLVFLCSDASHEYGLAMFEWEAAA